MAIPVGNGWNFFVFFVLFWFFFSFFFSVSVKDFPATPLLSGVFAHRVFCVYFLRSEGVVEMRRFWLVDTGEYLTNLQWRRSH